MAKVVVRFFDDETLEGVARDIDFDEPDFLVEVDDAGGLENNETAWIPLTAVKWVELPRDQELASETPTRKVAIRFLDGEVLRGHLDGSLERHRYGVVLHLHAEQADSPIRKLGIPFSAVKALFFIREFDARGEEAGSASETCLARRTMAPLLAVLEEMDRLTRLHRDGLLTDDEYSSKRTLVLERLKGYLSSGVASAGAAGRRSRAGPPRPQSRSSPGSAQSRRWRLGLRPRHGRAR